MNRSLTPAPSPGFMLLAAVLTMFAGGAMALQGRANGALAAVVGNGMFAAFVSFAVGLVILLIVQLLSPAARRALSMVVSAVRSKQLPVWMILGGIGGASVVIAQSITVPVMGVAMFTMSFVCGQLAGALVVDCTHLPPGGKTGLGVWRLVGVGIVVVAVVLSAQERIAGGVPIWAPLLPFIAGTLTSFQQAFNGRVKQYASSAVAATTVNFLVGTVFLGLCVLIVMATGVRWQGLPQVPAEAWMLIGGALGVMFIGLTTVTVAALGVLLLSLVSLFGNLLASLLLDAFVPAPGAAVSALTVASVLLVLLGVGVASLPRRFPRR